MVFVDHMMPQHSVIKVPRDQNGLEHNIREAYVYRKYRNQPDRHKIVYAPCRLLTSGCLLMSFVSTVSRTELPSWASFIDGEQVGKLKDRFVAYDGGLDIPDEDRAEALHWAGADYQASSFKRWPNQSYWGD